MAHRSGSSRHSGSVTLRARIAALLLLSLFLPGCGGGGGGSGVPTYVEKRAVFGSDDTGVFSFPGRVINGLTTFAWTKGRHEPTLPFSWPGPNERGSPAVPIGNGPWPGETGERDVILFLRTSPSRFIPAGARITKAEFAIYLLGQDGAPSQRREVLLSTVLQSAPSAVIGNPAPGAVGSSTLLQGTQARLVATVIPSIAGPGRFKVDITEFMRAHADDDVLEMIVMNSSGPNFGSQDDFHYLHGPQAGPEWGAGYYAPRFIVEWE